VSIVQETVWATGPVWTAEENVALKGTKNRAPLTAMCYAKIWIIG